MEDADFVADSDEDEQELLAALATTEDEIARRNELLAAGVATTTGDSNTAALAGGSDGESANNEESMKQDPPLQDGRQVHQEEEHKTGSGRSLATSETHLNEEEEQSEQFGAEGEEEAVSEDSEPGAAQPDAAESSQLEVGTLVEVESRTWPGINKPGGSGRIVRVHREKGEDGMVETLFFDVRYVLGGIEKHIEGEFVQSSRILEQQSNREPVPRDFYHGISAALQLSAPLSCHSIPATAPTYWIIVCCAQMTTLTRRTGKNREKQRKDANWKQRTLDLKRHQ
ncbi:hypothetical protein BBJ28_00000353 [Nothophytophthora sp. Chile5]|nr:hypothetical protein BBJ28_00000353 [Nothophytophthora sp. Chile5]